MLCRMMEYKLRAFEGEGMEQPEETCWAAHVRGKTWGSGRVTHGRFPTTLPAERRHEFKLAEAVASFRRCLPTTFQCRGFTIYTIKPA